MVGAGQLDLQFGHQNSQGYTAIPRRVDGVLYTAQSRPTLRNRTGQVCRDMPKFMCVM
jgi:hypothetical protein